MIFYSQAWEYFYAQADTWGWTSGSTKQTESIESHTSVWQAQKPKCSERLSGVQKDARAFQNRQRKGGKSALTKGSESTLWTRNERWIIQGQQRARSDLLYRLLKKVPIWGSVPTDDSSTPGGKKTRKEAPTLGRHLLIYDLLGPRRFAADGELVVGDNNGRCS